MADVYYPPRFFQYENHIIRESKPNESCPIRVTRPILTPEEYGRRHKMIEKAVEDMMRPIAFPTAKET